ncbi:hypothetical protein GXW78_00465 [Roseomonas terrae]|uniref:Uncharacterized protein n=1 Tax=Neoroseomonas terrae TaxID=424799 RepID=A0ABS5EAR8_9PROT|nr:hypothetical protein [Neoroseomonas terrae]MBR0648119.1 hypothetical protein [Neoroseomonas terrae]
MSLNHHLARGIVLANALLTVPALAQDRMAVFIGSGESAEVVYVSPNDPRARTAQRTAPDIKSPLIAVLTDNADGVSVNYFATTASPANLAPNAFRSVPLSMRTDGQAGLSRRGDEAWGTGE